ncbi:MAG TPA: EAL domain-containing protein [Spirochaetota bacterium]|nr:EAL domain-containing protein [Spirochaetota bacterium]
MKKKRYINTIKSNINANIALYSVITLTLFYLSLSWQQFINYNLFASETLFWSGGLLLLIINIVICFFSKAAGKMQLVLWLLLLPVTNSFFIYKLYYSPGSTVAMLNALAFLIWNFVFFYNSRFFFYFIIVYLLTLVAIVNLAPGITQPDIMYSVTIAILLGGLLLFSQRRNALTRLNAFLHKRRLREKRNRTVLENKLINLSFYDKLTRLGKKRIFIINMKEFFLKNEDKPAAVLYLDLDNFKKINERTDSESADRILMILGTRLRKSEKNFKNMARITSDEFVFFISGLNSREEAEKRAAKLLQIINEPFIINNNRFQLTASIGISFYPEHSKIPEKLVAHAEIAMFAAKKAGKNRFYNFEWEMFKREADRIKIETGLKDALLNDEFYINYQPKIDLRTNKINGMEALLRWKSDNQTIISPTKFIPIAEKNGLIIDIGYWVLKKACLMNKQLQEAGLDKMVISVNVSPMQFQQPDLVEKISLILTETGLEGQWLELEITESTAMQDPDKGLAVLKKLQNLGIKIAIDDFGTGFSSFSKLIQMPVNTIKIDRSFIKDLNHNIYSTITCSSIINLSHSLGYTVVAEGVETKEQYEYLREKKCDQIQGFIYFKPMDEKKFKDILHTKPQIN